MRKVLIGLAIGLASAALALALGQSPFVGTVEMKTYDWRMRAVADPSAAHDDIVLVNIDEKSLRSLEPLVGRWPWPRVIHSYLLDFLARAPVKVVAYDVLFTEADRRHFQVGGEDTSGEQSDQALAESTRQAGTIVHIADAVAEPLESDRGKPGTPAPPLPGGPFHLDASVEDRPIVTPPIPSIANASRAIGHNFVVLDSDGPLRRYVPFIRSGQQWVPALGMAAALIALDIRPDDVRLDRDGLWLRDRFLPLQEAEIPSYYGEHRTSRRALLRYAGSIMNDGHPLYKRLSFYDLFYSEQQILAGEKPLVDPATLKGKIIVVGATAPALSDLFTVPVSGKMPGAAVHATMIDDVLSRRTLRKASWGESAVASLVAGAALGVAGTMLGPWIAMVLALLSAAGVTATHTALFGHGVWLALAEPLMAIALATFAGVTYQWVAEGREKQRVKKIFQRYVSRDVCDQLMDNPALASLGGQRRDMSVLFSDIRGFTSVSERGEPEDIVAQLNEYFSRMVPVVFAHRGTVDKFVGDMIMALFGAPLTDPQHAEHAVETAVAMVEELHRMNAEWAAAGRPTLDIGIGINSGDMVAGNIGSETIMSYTVIGDNVNLGSRLESLNKQFGSRIIISAATRQRLQGQYDIRPLGGVTVKGKTQSVDIFEVAVPAPVAGEAGGV